MIGITDKQHPDAIRGPESDKMSEEELEGDVTNKLVTVNKYKALQNRKRVCAITGDGVNSLLLALPSPLRLWSQSYHPTGSCLQTHVQRQSLPCPSLYRKLNNNI
jgi:hypothetical protein